MPAGSSYVLDGVNRFLKADKHSGCTVLTMILFEARGLWLS
jgi:hypothetical protein